MPSHQSNVALPVLVVLAASISCSTEREPDRKDEPSTSAVARATAVVASRPIGDTLVVYKSPTCGCCQAWVDTMRAKGFAVRAIDTANVTPVKLANGVPNALSSCHTALVGGYALEGHVPPDDIRRLLKDRPDIAGLAVPGMPMGAPGMEGPRKDRYDVIAFLASGAQRVFSRY